MRTDPSLRELRVATIRGTGAVLAVGIAVAVALLAIDEPLAPVAIVVLTSAFVLQAGVAVTVGRVWEPASELTFGWLLLTVALVATLVAVEPVRDPEVFWLLLVPVGVGAVTLTRWRLLLLGAAAVGWYVVGAAASAGLSAGVTVARVTGLALVGAALAVLVDRLEAALAERDAARLLAGERASRLALVARSARRLEGMQPSEVLDAALRATAELGWPEAAIVLAQGGDGERLVRSRGFRLPDDPLTGAVVRAMRLDVAVRPTPDDPAIRASGLTTALVAPIRIEGEPRGALLVGGRTSRIPDPTEDEAVGLVAWQTARALEIAGRLDRELHKVEALERLGRERDDFVSTIAHELRTPVTAIIGLAETLRHHRERLPAERHDQVVTRIEANARSLESIVTSMLDLAKLERGTLELLVEPVDVTEVIRRTVSRLETLLGQHHVVLALPPVRARVAGDPRLLERVVENLLMNAARHTPPGTTVIAEARVAQTAVTVRIADDGPGIAAADVARLGERFRRAGPRSTRERTGTGLGMSLVVEVLRLHGTELTVDTEVGEGASFAFALPRASEFELEAELDLSPLGTDELTA